MRRIFMPYARSLQIFWPIAVLLLIGAAPAQRT
jgi:hypothetical protein